MKPLRHSDLVCPAHLPGEYIPNLLASRERTQRFTGVKLARLRGDAAYCKEIAGLADDKEEDVYVRLEAVSYLAAMCGYPEPEQFESYLESPDDQIRLEAVIALGEAATPGAVDLLWGILDNKQRPYFLRSAAAWSLSRVRGEESVSKLVRSLAMLI